ncbi:Nicotinate phosphoribosyltransferase 2 [Acholeplasma oculi]|uniref:Nicotinate phosphoribosyltransferase n=1 Tax=Acholeplasma oculi TaxID=35623 RepID=A0A061ABE6_9MOLU|nr:nicotinate phosphoribosyltransferase [Acholeplasma oculi]CDR30709.1 Nicotinate phosphoribosyltransferase [Acholeplasma oculi]SKC34703.1 nicotinate phosphoribosyltransferase [Acholeplasma oculi]SUT89543.1 Nicotinate phosphoribosyltransferase 2 [Acholeplasma oculi]
MKRNLSLLMDFYELTMANGYFKDGRHQDIAVFDVFFRSIPDDGGYAIFAGLESIIDYIENLRFDDEDINYLKSRNIFDEGFLKYLENFKFTSDVYAIEEGTPIFPNEPLFIIKGPIIECQLIETMVLLSINHQSLIATKTSRIVREAKGRPVFEFGARRAHSFDAANLGARSAYIGGVTGTSNTLAGRLFNIPALGTMAHSYVQSFESEFEAFKSYALNYPDNTLLLVDTYDTLHQGIPNAIRVHNEILKPMGKSLKGIRIDSGDLAYLSKKVRTLLDEAGLTDTKITVSNALDEFIIRDLVVHQDAMIDSFGVGERLITARSEAVFGGVFKLSALEEDGKLIPKIKISDNVAKTTIPGFKQLYRFYDENNMAIADLITLHDEVIDSTKPYTLFDPMHPWKQKVVENFRVEKKLVPIFEKGKLVYNIPKLSEIRKRKEQLFESLWKEVIRLKNPHEYYVDLSQDLWDIRQELITKHKN